MDKEPGLELEPYCVGAGSPCWTGGCAAAVALRRLCSLHRTLSPLTVQRRSMARRVLETRLSLGMEGREARPWTRGLLGEEGAQGVLRRRMGKQDLGDIPPTEDGAEGLKGRALRSSSEGEELLLGEGNSRTSPSSSSYCCLMGKVPGAGVRVTVTCLETAE